MEREGSRIPRFRLQPAREPPDAPLAARRRFVHASPELLCLGYMSYICASPLSVLCIRCVFVSVCFISRLQDSLRCFEYCVIFSQNCRFVHSLAILHRRITFFSFTSMRLTLVQLAVGLGLAGLGLALPSEDLRLRSYLSGRALTPDNTCGNIQNGNNKGFTCDPSNANGGGCCSASGWCGEDS